MKACAFCAEEIQDAAIKCRHCGSDQPQKEVGEGKVLTPIKSPKKSRKKLLAVCLGILALLVAAFLLIETDDDSRRYWPGQYRSDISDAAELAVKDKLTDPYSAQFLMVEVVDATKGARVVCGWVNDKNKMGGYVGPRPFVYHEINKSVAIQVLSTDHTTNTPQLQQLATAARFDRCEK